MDDLQAECLQLANRTATSTVASGSSPQNTSTEVGLKGSFLSPNDLFFLKTTEESKNHILPANNPVTSSNSGDSSRK